MAKRKKAQKKAIPIDPFAEAEDRQTELVEAKITVSESLKDSVDESTSEKPKTASTKKRAKTKSKKKAKTRSKAKKKTEKVIAKDPKQKEIAAKLETGDHQVMEQGDNTLEVTSSPKVVVDQMVEDPLDELMAIIDGDDKSTELEAMLAGVLPEPLEIIPTEQHVVFILEEREYAIPIINVLEIGQPMSATALPFVPTWLLGIANLRGEIISIVDLRTFLGLPETRIKHTHSFMIVRTNQDDMRMGLIVDRVLGSHHLVVEHIEEVKKLRDDPLEEFVRATYDHAGRSLIVLDFDRFLKSSDIQQFKAI